MPIMESMSQDEFEEISEGLINWLVMKVKEPGIVQMRLNILNELISEAEKSALNNLLPWEMGNV